MAQRDMAGLAAFGRKRNLSKTRQRMVQLCLLVLMTGALAAGISGGDAHYASGEFDRDRHGGPGIGNRPNRDHRPHHLVEGDAEERCKRRCVLPLASFRFWL